MKEREREKERKLQSSGHLLPGFSDSLVLQSEYWYKACNNFRGCVLQIHVIL